MEPPHVRAVESAEWGGGGVKYGGREEGWRRKTRSSGNLRTKYPDIPQTRLLVACHVAETRSPTQHPTFCPPLPPTVRAPAPRRVAER